MPQCSGQFFAGDNYDCNDFLHVKIRIFLEYLERKNLCRKRHQINESANVILEEFTKEYIIEKRLFPYIPFYIARYEKEIVSENNVDNAVEDLEYFREQMVRLHRRKNYWIMSL